MTHIWDLSTLPHLSERQYIKLPIQHKCGDVVAFGGNLSPGLLLSAYSQGIFPWYSEGEPILWWSPQERCILPPKELHLSRSLTKTLRRHVHAFNNKINETTALRCSIDEDFSAVIRACAETPRKNQQTNKSPNEAAATWITEKMQRAYVALHKLGYAHSVECWKQNEHETQEKLVGGLYGVSLGRCFFGESMFSCEKDASKMAFAIFALFLKHKDFELIDCQQNTAHLQRFGAYCVPRSEFLHRLAACQIEPGQKAVWRSFAQEFRFSLNSSFYSSLADYLQFNFKP